MGKMFPDFLALQRAVQQERPALGEVPQNVAGLQKKWLMTGHEICLCDQVSRANRPPPEAQMRNGHRARFFRIVNEISLSEVVGVFADDFDRFLVGADGSVGPEPEELCADDLIRFDEKVRIEGKACLGNIVVDADGEMILRRGLRQMVEDPLDHDRSSLDRRCKRGWPRTD